MLFLAFLVSMLSIVRNIRSVIIVFSVHLIERFQLDIVLKNKKEQNGFDFDGQLHLILLLTGQDTLFEIYYLSKEYTFCMDLSESTLFQ